MANARERADAILALEERITQMHRQHNETAGTDDAGTQRAWGGEQISEFTNLMDELDRQRAQHETLTRYEQMQRQNETPAGPVAVDAHNESTQRAGIPAGTPAADDWASFVEWAHTGYYQGHYTDRFDILMPSLNPDEHMREEEDRIGARIAANRRTLTTSSPSGIVPGNTVGTLRMAMYTIDPVRTSGATVITTSDGNQIKVPYVRHNSTATPIVAENSAAAANDPAFNTIDLDAYVYRADTDVTDEMVEDNGIGLLRVLPSVLTNQILAARGTDHVSGSGTNEPSGVIDDLPAAQMVTTGSATDTPDASEWLSMLGQVSSAYAIPAQQAIIMSSQYFYRYLLAAQQGSGTTFPLLRETSPLGMIRHSLAGVPVYMSDAMASGALSASTLIAALYTPSLMYIRDVRGVRVTRDTSSVARNGAVRLHFRGRGDSEYMPAVSDTLAGLQTAT